MVALLKMLPDTQSLKDVTISVVSHGHGQVMAALLRDLEHLPDASAARVIVTLNLADEVFDPAQFGRLQIEVIRNLRPKGFGANHNAAFGLCNTPWFAILNPDLRLPQDPFAPLQAVVAQRPGLALIAPKVVNMDGVLEDSVRRNLTPLSLVQRSLGNRSAAVVRDVSEEGRAFYWIAGMFYLVRADAFKQVHGFDERFFMYCEDYDLCARLYGAGHPVSYSEVISVIHDARRASHRSLRHFAWHLRSFLRVWTSRAFWKVTLAGR